MRDEPWKTLFIKALQMLNSANIKQDGWTFGGGTALMLYFNHRTSYDRPAFLGKFKKSKAAPSVLKHRKKSL